MKFNLTIDTSGAAFQADPLELQRCIKNTANRVSARMDRVPGPLEGPVVDANGNTCGHWALTED